MAADPELTKVRHCSPWTSQVHASGDGVEKLLFRMLDGEDDPKLQRDVRECISTLLASLASSKPSHWLVLCNQVNTQGPTTEACCNFLRFPKALWLALHLLCYFLH